MVPSSPMRRRSLQVHGLVGLLTAATVVSSGCMGVSSQLRPTDYSELETLSDLGSGGATPSFSS